MSFSANHLDFILGSNRTRSPGCIQHRLAVAILVAAFPFVCVAQGLTQVEGQVAPELAEKLEGGGIAGACPFGSPNDCFQCGDPDEPGCTDMGCCNIVCEEDPLCCFLEWDCACATLAQQFCNVVINDSCASPQTIAGGTTSFDTTIATTDGPAHPGCTNFGDGQIHKDIWYRYNATATGTLNISLCNSFFDTVVAVYQGTACVGNLLGCNDDECGTRSKLAVPVTAGQSYKIRVGGFQGASGAGSIILCPPGLCDNDECDNSNPIFDGETDFDSSSATTDGPSHNACCIFGDCQVGHDLWFDYIASCTGSLSVELCGSHYDTRLALYSGFNCFGTLLACNDDFCDSHSGVTLDVTEGEELKIRIGGYDDDDGIGMVTITCESIGTCPPAEIVSAIPPSGIIDARQPSPPNGVPLQGIGIGSELVQVQMPEGLTGAVGCFEVCETSAGGLPAIEIAEVQELGAGLYSIRLNRAITPGAVTTVRYAGGTGHVTYTTHPANANGDNSASPVDILAIIDMLNGVLNPPHGIYSRDIDRSGVPNPADILRVIDLLNGADAYVVWNGTALPSTAGCP